VTWPVLLSQSGQFSKEGFTIAEEPNLEVRAEASASRPRRPPLQRGQRLIKQEDDESHGERLRRMGGTP
jgi:hypothetical protein